MRKDKADEEELERRHREGYERQPVQEGEFPPPDDADELRPEYRFDYRKARPNRFKQ